MPEGFNVARPLLARSATATSARASLTTTGVSVVTLAGRASTATSARAALARSRPLVARAPTATSARAALTLYAGAGPPGVFAVFRELVAGVLASLELTAETEVHALPVDAITAPAFMLEWADPWTVPATHCLDDAHLEVVCVVGRVEPAAAIETLEEMVAAALVAFNHAGIPHGTTSAPRPLDIGGVDYLAARILVHQHVNVGA